MPPPPAPKEVWEPKTLDFYRRVQAVLTEAGIPFLVGGAFALEFYTDIWRATKDFDIFVRPDDCPRVLELLAAKGYQTELPYPHWLGKVFADGDMIDVIFSSGNGVARVDDGWFQHAPEGVVLGISAPICPVEEMIWSKSFVLERERFDGADVAHLLRACAAQLDWPRLLERFGPNWEVLFSHLLMFRFIYPCESNQVPAWVLEELLERVQRSMQTPAAAGPRFRGTLISREQYLVDLARWGYADARLQPAGNLTAREIAIWTRAIGK